ncbi:hypothetical protein [Microbacterium sp. GXF6406]
MRLHRTLVPLAVIGALALTGCSSSGSADAEPAVDYDYDFIAMGEPGEITAAGSALSFGEVAWFEGPINEGEDPYEIGVVVHDVIEAPEGFLEDAVSNPEDFTQYTPYIIITQFHAAQDVVDAHGGMRNLSLQPLLADGTPGAYLTTMAVSKTDECGASVPEWEGGEDMFSCLIGLAEEGQQITGALFDDTTQATVVLDPENPYQASPVTWSAP